MLLCSVRFQSSLSTTLQLHFPLISLNTENKPVNLSPLTAILRNLAWWELETIQVVRLGTWHSSCFLCLSLSVFLFFSLPINCSVSGELSIIECFNCSSFLSYFMYEEGGGVSRRQDRVNHYHTHCREPQENLWLSLLLQTGLVTGSSNRWLRRYPKGLLQGQAWKNLYWVRIMLEKRMHSFFSIGITMSWVPWVTLKGKARLEQFWKI